MTFLNVPRYGGPEIPTVGDHAVVVGASMAGLFAARVLSDAFDRVTVIDRDPLPDDPIARRGVPQASHAHILLEAGWATIEDLFPGYTEELLSAGGLTIDATTDVTYYTKGGVLADGPRRLPMYCASRPLFEHLVRRRVADLERITLRPNCVVTDYRLDESGTTVTGVEIRNSGRDVLDADLVVDATGRTSRTPAWLEDNGYPRPDVDEVRVDLTYQTLSIERPADNRRTPFAPSTAPRTRGGGAIPVEGDRWQVTLQGVHGDAPPGDPEGFLSYAESLPLPDISHLLETRTWLSEEIHGYSFRSNLRRRYEELSGFPDGLVVVGDAVASFNPIYGQGMSVAALESLILHRLLATGDLADLPIRFFDRTGDLVDVVWAMAAGSDFEYPQTTGPKPRGTDLLNRYVSRVLRAAHTDGVVTDAFYRVLRLERHPRSLLRPNIARRVLLPG